MIFAAGMLNWSLISFINLATSLVLRFSAPKRGTAFYFWTCTRQGYFIRAQILFFSLHCSMIVFFYFNQMMCAFFLIIFFASGFRFRGRVLPLWFVFIYAALVIVLQVIYLALCASRDSPWSIADDWWIKLLGLMK